ncbi:hypothetical protein BX666DRAFT_1857913 [Dichotomocladium elegans]|nr:hypothetical protein BX666DRAFT_1857913 [Dichotomocladium elegans]
MIKYRRRQQQHPTLTNASVRKRINFTAGLLSDELVLHIFSFLTAADLIRCTKVNTKWLRLSNDEMLWKPLFLNRFRTMRTTLPAPRSQWWGNCGSSSKEVRPSYWKSLYRINHNWRIGNSRNTNDGRIITCLKLETDPDRCHHYRLAAGYDNGGFTLWAFDTALPAFEATELVIHSPVMSCHESNHSSSSTAVEAIGLSFPVVLTCTKGMKLSAYHIDPSPRLIYELQSPIRWSPIVVELDQCPYESGRWRAMACFGMPVGLNGYSAGIQEIVFSSKAIISSRHCSAVSESDMFFTAHSRPESLEPMTALVYSEPYLMTAHANNTIKQYCVVRSKEKLELNFIQTLYGHTSKVHALALNTSVGRLVSGDRYGLKVWDLAQNGKPRFPMASASAAATTSVDIPYRDMRWLQFDSDKIVAALCGDRRCCGSDTNDTIFTSPKGVQVKIWSFC